MSFATNEQLDAQNIVATLPILIKKKKTLLGINIRYSKFTYFKQQLPYNFLISYCQYVEKRNDVWHLIMGSWIP